MDTPRYGVCDECGYPLAPVYDDTTGLLVDLVCTNDEYPGGPAPPHDEPAEIPLAVF